MIKYVNGEYIEMTEEEIAEFERENNPFLNCTYEEAVNKKIREQYSESQEFAILRQKDEKPDEYAEYYKYCEECKKTIKEMLSQPESE